MPAFDWLELEKEFLYRRVLAGKTEVVLEFAGEIRFGPEYCALWMRVDGRPEDGRYFGPGRNVVFGVTMKLSHDGRYVVLERWHRRDKPDTSAILIDAYEGREVELLRMGSDFLTAITFEPDGVRLAFERAAEAQTFPFPKEWQRTSWWL